MTIDITPHDLGSASVEARDKIAEALGLPPTIPRVHLFDTAFLIASALRNLNKVERASLIKQLRNQAKGIRDLGSDPAAVALELAAATMEDVVPGRHAVQKLLLARREGSGSAPH